MQRRQTLMISLPDVRAVALAVAAVDAAHGGSVDRVGTGVCSSAWAASCCWRPRGLDGTDGERLEMSMWSYL